MGEKKDSDDENDVVEEEGNQDNDESHKKKKKDNLAQGKHYNVFVVQCPTKKALRCVSLWQDIALQTILIDGFGPS